MKLYFECMDIALIKHVDSAVTFKVDW